MNTIPKTYISRVLWCCLTAMIIFVISGCQIAGVTQITPTPNFFHFVYSTDQPFYLEFDFPSSWRVTDSKETYGSYRVLTFQDAILPTPDLRQRPSLDSAAYVSISLEPASQKTADNKVDQLIRERGKSGKYILLEDYMVTISNFPVRVTEYQIASEPLGYPQNMYEKQWYFTRGNQLYIVSFLIAEDERNNDFEKNFESMIGSLKILP